MTAIAIATHGRTTEIETAGPRPSLEELVDRLMAAVLGECADAPEPPEPSAARTIHRARRLSRAGDADGALAALAGVDASAATPREARWAFCEWRRILARRLGGRDAVVYSQGAGRAAALVPRGDGTLEVAAVLGMRWSAGKVVSARSLRGLRPLGRRAA